MQEGLGGDEEGGRAHAQQHDELQEPEAAEENQIFSKSSDVCVQNAFALTSEDLQASAAALLMVSTTMKSAVRFFY